MKKLLAQGERRFKNDPRYNLQNVTDGFAPRIDEGGDDTALLERICAAYIKATEQQPLAKREYEATDWWKAERESRLGPVRRALAGRNIETLGRMYRNFFRDACSSGVSGVPLHMEKAYVGGRVRDVYQRFFLVDALHRIDYWKSQTGGRFELRELAGPAVGNPFGVQIADTLVRVGAEYQHYCAHRIRGLVSSDSASVAEIGGGFGGMAYYLLRDSPLFRYVDFDVPESLALTSYYLLKALPHSRFLLFGEEEFAPASRNKFNVILMPVFELGKMQAKSVDLTFSSHAMSDLSSGATIEYMNEIVRATRNFFLYVGGGGKGRSLQELVRAQYGGLRLVDERGLEWNRLKVADASEVELLYRFDEGE